MVGYMRITDNQMTKILNFRDFGGYSTTEGKFLRKGMLYRSGHLDSVNRSDLDILKNLGIKTIIDLRSRSEIKKERPFIASIHHINLPIDFDMVVKNQLKPLIWKKNAFDTIASIFDRMYLDMVDTSHSRIRKVFEILTNKENLPVLIHCRAGKDRTGFMCAIIQLALDVATENIFSDYLLTNQYFFPQISRTLQRLKYFTLGLYPTKNIVFACVTRQRCLNGVFDRIHQNFKTVGNYLNSCGVDTALLKTAKHLLLK